VDEDHYPVPTSTYAPSKVASETVAGHIARWSGIPFVALRDVAAACRLALAAPPDAVAGSPSFIIAAADTVMNRPSADLLAEVFPDVRLTRDIGEFDTAQHSEIVQARRLGHRLSGVRGIYSHVTPTMQQHLTNALQCR
jgi:nucleoside-diphosphate-sugar epimerase